VLLANRLMQESSELQKDKLFLSLASWIPTPSHTVERMLQMARVRPKDVVCDLRCGDARILITAVEQFEAKGAIGYELREDLYNASLEEIKRRNLLDKVTIYKEDFVNAALAQASVITLSLSYVANKLLSPKPGRELRCGTRIVSLHFEIDSWKTTGFMYGWNPPFSPIYLYVMPEAFR
jgi:hypothetical protein